MAIHTAARIKSAAHGGQIVVSAATARDLELGELTLSSLGVHRLRDIAGQTELFQVDHADLGHEFPPLASEPSDFNPAPTYLAGLVARTGEQAAIGRLLEERRIVTITGPPGVGKTRLAAAISRGRNDVAFVDLGAIDDSSLVAGRVAGALGVQPAGSEDPLDAVVRQLGDASALIFIDNCEHLIEEAASVVARATARCACLRVLATSREPLAIEGETVWPLEPLAEAAELFVARVHEAHPATELSADDPRVLAICDLVDHLPLAVELAAAQVGRMSLRDLIGRLDDHVEQLEGTRRDAPSRHRTLQSAIEWSVRLLADRELAALRRLAVMRGPFDLAAAQAVCAESASVIGALRERSLLAHDGDASSGRFRMLGTIRSYVIDTMCPDERDAAEEAHARVFQARARERIAGTVRNVGSLAAFDEDADNYQLALRWLVDHDPASALSVAVDLEGLWTARLSTPAGARMLAAIVDAARDAPKGLRSIGLVILAEVYRNAGMIDEARRATEESIELGGADVRHGHMSGAILLGQILAMQGELAAAERLFEESLKASRVRGDLAKTAFSLRELANIALESNRPDDAVDLLEEASALAHTSEETRWMDGLLAADRARVAFAQGRVEDARAGYEMSMAGAQQFGIASAIASCGLGLARVERIVGSPEHARALLHESVRIYRGQGDAGGLAHAYVEAALLHSGASEHDRAIQLLAAADAARSRIGIVTPGSEAGPISDARTAATVALGAEIAARHAALGLTLTVDDVVALI